MSQPERLITEHLDIWTSAIEQKSTKGRGSNSKINLYGIKKLRELILDLAVRGLLVPQDPSDEPASVLLERIKAEKERLVKEGKIKRQKALPEISEEEKPFGLPKGWEWSYLGDLSSDIHYGYTASAKTNDRGIRLLRITDIQNDRVNWQSVPACDITEEKSKLYLLENDDVLIARTGGTIGKSYLVENINVKSVFASYLIRVKRISAMFSPYIKTYLGSRLYWLQLYDNATGTGQPNVNATALKRLIVPIAPHNEQQRIVAKVNDLMHLCDQLEQETTTKIQAHQTLVETLLNVLTNAADKGEFDEAWGRIVEYFDMLFTTEHSVDLLKQTILQLAVMGKLVRQDPSDEPASVLLGRIKAEKERLVKEGKIKKQKALPEISEEEKPFELPEGWEWCRLPDVGELARGKSKHRPRNDPKLYKNGTMPLVQTGDVAKAGNIIKSYSAKYNENGIAQSRIWKKGTLCITIAANIADTGILGFDACFPDSVVGFTPYDKGSNTNYFEVFLRTAKQHLSEYAPSTAQKNINLEILGKLYTPVPPNQEQDRIMRKLKDIEDICEKIKLNIRETRYTMLNLADSVSEEIV